MKKEVKMCMLGALVLALSNIAYADAPTLEEIGATVNSIEQEYQELLSKEAEKKVEFQQEKVQLEGELAALKEQDANKEKMLAKLAEDSEIRWHRKEYKKLSKEYQDYYKKLEKTIQDREQQIQELDTILQIMN